MKLDMYEIGQYTDTKRYYIGRLKEVDEVGTISRSIVCEGMRTRGEAEAIKSELDKVRVDQALRMLKNGGYR